MSESQDIQYHVRRYYENWFMIDSLYGAWAARRGVQFNTVLVLDLIRENPQGCTQKHICDKTALPKQTVSFLLSGLEKKGYIHRKQNDSDRRGKLVALTPAGEQFAFPLLDELATAEENAYENLTEQQRRAITDGMTSLVEALQGSLAD